MSAHIYKRQSHNHFTLDRPHQLKKIFIMQTFVAVILLAASLAAADIVPFTPAVGKSEVTLGKPGIITYATQHHQVIPAVKAIEYAPPVVPGVQVGHPNTYVAGVHPTTYIDGHHPLAYVSGVQPSVYAQHYVQPAYVQPSYVEPSYVQPSYVPGVQPIAYAAQPAYVPGVQAYVPEHHNNYVAAVHPN